MSPEFHVSEEDLLMALDSELPVNEAARVRSHLAACWACRERSAEMETAIADFIRFQRSSFESQNPSPDGPRALLKARLRQVAADDTSRPSFLQFFGLGLRWTALLSGLVVVVLGAMVWLKLPGYRAQPPAVTIPNRTLTPGATVLLSQPEVCLQTGDKNRIVPVALQQRVFAEYGIRAAKPGDYELDYLITPALGGADDIHNLWPESNHAGLWNARVKDALEDHLRDMVCNGQLDLQTAQREIAGDWILAYKKYFHTEQPIVSDQ